MIVTDCYDRNSIHIYVNPLALMSVSLYDEQKEDIFCGNPLGVRGMLYVKSNKFKLLNNLKIPILNIFA